MLEVRLFFGFPIGAAFASALQNLNPEITALFIREEDAYLQEVYYRERRYIGKYIGHKTELANLELLEANIYSILKKLVPDFPYKDEPLILFPALENPANK